ncbi:alpha/beta fold hydrolase [Anaerocolumna chitinilytica]|uniref:Ndr family protein n=1 Tax=Anaerocolumna chitinilytica TaxID=1727145 RepID=A0A7I8DK86_9FIRM|nr:alpha/beta hydrolase [Anaerocolumna chitinilytica]BCJ98888.1 Ndr family protein [Anaerocolumna chitinilytica]
MKLNHEIYKSDDAKNEIISMYDEFVKRYEFVKSIQIETIQGITHVLVCGEENKPPLILLHGSGMNSSMWLGELQEYAKYYRVYAVDIPGEPGKSFPIQMPLTDNSYSKWLHDVMTKLNVRKANVVGISLGGWMALNYAIVFPDDVDRLVLISPSGIGKQKVSFLLYAIWYGLRGEKGVEKLISKINGGKQLHPNMLRYQKCIRNGFQYRTGKIPILSDEEIQNLAVPCCIIVGEKDIMLSSQDTIQRIKKLLPQAQTNYLEGEGHALVNVTKKVCDFLLQDRCN